MINLSLENESDNSLSSSSIDLSKQFKINGRRFVWLSKFPLVFINQSKTCRLQLFEIYKFADGFDIILMIIGTLAG